MTVETKTYPQRVLDRFSAGQSLPYVCDVIDGKIDKPDKLRLDSCWRAINKVVGDRKAIDVSMDGELTIKVMHYGNGHNT